MKSLIRLLVIVAGSLGFAGLAQAADSVILPENVFPQLEQILQKAVTQSPRMIARNLDLMVAEGDLLQAKAGLYPTLSGFYQYSYTQDTRRDVPGTLDTDKIYYNLSLNQPVFHWNERRNNARIGELRKKIAGEQYADAYRILAQEIRSLYLQLIVKKIALGNVRNTAALADNNLRLAEEKLSKKVTSEAEIHQIRIDTDQARLTADFAETEFANLKQYFSALTGQPALADEAVPDDIGGLPSSMEGINRLLAGFLTQTDPETITARVMRKQIEVEDLTYQNNRKRLLPKFNFVAGLSQDEQSYTANLAAKYGVESKFVGMQMVWTIFDGFAARGAITSSLGRKRQLEQGYKQYTEALAQDAQRAAKQVELASRQMQITDRMLASSANFINFRREDFKRGLASETDIANAESGHKTMIATSANARYNYLMRVIEFVGVIGEDPALSHVTLPTS